MSEKQNTSTSCPRAVVEQQLKSLSSASQKKDRDTILRCILQTMKPYLHQRQEWDAIKEKIKAGDQSTIHQYMDLLPDNQSEEDELLKGFQNYADFHTAPKTIEKIVMTECGYRKEDHISVRVFLLRKFLLGAGFDCNTLPMEPLAQYIYKYKLEANQKIEYSKAKENYDKIVLLQKSFEVPNDRKDKTCFDAEEVEEIRAKCIDQALKVLQKIKELISRSEEVLIESGGDAQAIIGEVSGNISASIELADGLEKEKWQYGFDISELSEMKKAAHRTINLGLLGAENIARSLLGNAGEQDRKNLSQKLADVNAKIRIAEKSFQRQKKEYENRKATISALEQLRVRWMDQATGILADAIEESIFDDLQRLELTAEETLETLVMQMRKFEEKESKKNKQGSLSDLVLSEKTKKCLKQWKVDPNLRVWEQLEQVLEKCKKNHDNNDKDLQSLIETFKENWRESGSAYFKVKDKKTASGIYRTALKNVRQKKMLCLRVVQLCDDIAEGRFDSNREINRRNIFYIAAMLQIRDKTRIEQLFRDYYVDDILRYIRNDKHISENTNSSYEREPVGDSLNIKNPFELVSTWLICHCKDLSPGKLLDHIQEVIYTCSVVTEERIQKTGETAEDDDDDASMENMHMTWKREDDYNGIKTESDLIRYVVKMERYRIETRDDFEKESFWDTSRSDRMRKLEETVEEMEKDIIDKLSLEEKSNNSDDLQPEKESNNPYEVLPQKGSINVATQFWNSEDLKSVKEKALGYVAEEKDKIKLKKIFSEIHKRITTKRPFYQCYDTAIMSCVAQDLKAQKESADEKKSLCKATLKNRLADAGASVSDLNITNAIKALRELGWKIDEPKKDNYLLQSTGYKIENILEKNSIHSYSRTSFLAYCALCYAVIEQGWSVEGFEPKLTFSELQQQFTEWCATKFLDSRFAPFDIQNIVDRYVMMGLFANLCKKE